MKKDFFNENIKEGDILILGVGNYLLGDEGVGVHFIKYLETQDLPENVHLLDGGTGGYYLMPYMEGYKAVIMIDATIDGENPGHFRMIRPRFSTDYPPQLSAHDIGLKDMIEGMMLLDTLPDLYLLAVSIIDYDKLSIELTGEIEDAFPEMKNLVLKLVKNINVTHKEPTL
ncbi:MAG: hydrogenase maturation protease [Bacteroidota bacterium]